MVRYRDNDNAYENRPNFRPNRNRNSPVYSEFVVGHKGTQQQENGQWFEYFGYSLSSGKYFDNTTTYYAGGSPRGGVGLSGDVTIFDLSVNNDNVSSLPPEHVYKRQINSILPISPPSESESFGSYFGSVLLSVDLNGDGRDELLVGAPYYSLLRTPRAKRRVSHVTSSLREDEWTGDNGAVFVYFFTPNKTIVCIYCFKYTT